MKDSSKNRVNFPIFGPKLTVVLFDLCERQNFIFLVARKVLDRRIRRDELYCVRLADNLSNILCLQVFLADIARLIVEKTM